MRQWYRIEAKQTDSKPVEIADIYIFDQIGPSFWNDNAVTAATFVEQLKALPASIKTIRVHVNSPGGNVFDAVAIASALRAQVTDHQRTIEARIDGLAASAATIVTSSGDKVVIAESGMVMIHEPSTVAMGAARALRKTADLLDGIRNSIVAAYRRHSNKSDAELIELMAATTWMTADEAVKNGFATEISKGAPVTNCFTADSVTALGEVPEQFRAQVEALVKKPEPTKAEPPAKAEAAAPLEVLQICREADCVDMAEALIKEGASLADVQARVTAEQGRRRQAKERATEISAICATAKLPGLADGYVASAMPIDQVRKHLTTIVALRDSGEIDTKLAPNQGGPEQIQNGWKQAFKAAGK